LQELISDPSLQDVTDVGGMTLANQNQPRAQNQARQAPERVQSFQETVHDMNFRRQVRWSREIKERKFLSGKYALPR